MKKYLRFGEIPSGERSINFLKLRIQENKDFAWTKGNSGYGEAVSQVPEKAFEPGVSVFEMGVDGLPVLHNMREARSLAGRIGCKIYQVSGDEVGRGNDGEPLIKNIKVDKTRRITVENLEKHIITFLASNFCIVNQTEEKPQSGDYDIYCFWQQYQVNFDTKGKRKYCGFKEDGFVKSPGYYLFCFREWEFAFPRPGFDAEPLCKKEKNED